MKLVTCKSARSYQYRVLADFLLSNFPSSLPPHLPVLARRQPGGHFKGPVIVADARVADDLADLLDALGRQLQERLADRHPGLRLQLAESLVKKLPDQAGQILGLVTEVGSHFFQSHILNISHQVIYDHPCPGHRISIVDIAAGKARGIQPDSGVVVPGKLCQKARAGQRQFIIHEIAVFTRLSNPLAEVQPLMANHLVQAGILHVALRLVQVLKDVMH